MHLTDLRHKYCSVFKLETQPFISTANCSAQEKLTGIFLLFEGFFCPGGNHSAVPCPPGTFRSEGAALPSHSCLPCPVDFFNPRPGQKSCLPCGSEAAQPAEGQQTCVCLGKGQVFQVQEKFPLSHQHKFTFWSFSPLFSLFISLPTTGRGMGTPDL